MSVVIPFPTPGNPVSDSFKRLLTIAEAAIQLHVHERTVRRHIKSGEIPAFRLGRNVRIRQQDLDAALTPVGEINATSHEDDAFISSMTTALVKS